MVVLEGGGRVGEDKQGDAELERDQHGVPPHRTEAFQSDVYVPVPPYRRLTSHMLLHVLISIYRVHATH